MLGTIQESPTASETQMLDDEDDMPPSSLSSIGLLPGIVTSDMLMCIIHL